MTTNEHSDSRTLTASEIAQIAGVGSSAVSNWRRRHSDFPAEIDDGLYDREDVVAWLRKEEKSFDLGRVDSLESTFWKWAERTRGILRVDQMPEVLLQLFALRAAGSGKIERLQPLQGLWSEMETSVCADMGAVHRRIEQLIGDADVSLFEALRVSPLLHQLDTEDWLALVGLVGRLDPNSTDWGKLATDVVTGFLEKYATKGGVFSSGSDLVELMMVFLAPIEGKVYDPAFGAGVFLAAAWESGASSIERLYGQELVEQSWRVGFLHLLLQNASFELATGDTLLDDRFRDLRADRIALDPPLGLKPRYDPRQDDPRWRWGIPTRSSADLLWVEHVAFHLSDDGIGVVVVAPGSLSGSSEQHIRTSLLEDDMIEMVVQLPPGTLAATAIPACLVILRRERENKGEVLFIDARQLGSPERGGVRAFSSRDVSRVAGCVQDWRDGRFIEESQFAGSAAADDILKVDAVLSPHRFISYDEPISVIDGEPISERYLRLSDELTGQVGAAVVAGEALLESPPELRWAEATGGYESRRLGDLLALEPASGVGRTDEGEGEAIPYVTTEAVSQGPPVLQRLPAATTVGNVRGRYAERGDLLLVARGVERLDTVPCAKVEFEGRAAYSQSLIRLRVNDEYVDPDYLRLYLSSRRGSAALAAAATGSVISNLRREALSDVEIQVPDLETQRQMVRELKSIEKAMGQMTGAVEAMENLYDTFRESLAAGSLSAANGESP